ncbi:DUF418 domain-containing protein [Lysinibacillus sphaericus]|uniref:DUF418 domain-containing protein n=1 Tax=Lysinibacillus sphaericus TaxID=1421 RepID=UPI003D08C219
MMTKRVSFIDGMRGFSLLGISLANLLIFQFGMYGKDELKNLSTLDSGALYFVKVFIEGSSMPIFSILFGYSLIKLIESIRKKKNRSRWSIVRRAIGLIAIGWLHSRYFWEGDILSYYGIIIFFLIPFINRKAKTLFIWSGIFFVFSTINLLFIPVVELSKKEQLKMDTYIEESNAVYADGSYLDVYYYRLNDMPPGFDDPVDVGIIQILAPLMFISLFLLGMGLAKKRAFENMEIERRWYALGALFVPLGLICKSVSFIDSIFSGMLLIGGSLLLSIGYICLAALLISTRLLPFLLHGFESVGKLSMTNYLLQTIICTFVFYGYGLGLYGKIGVFSGIIFGITLYCLQCVFSVYYLKRFNRGPFENVLRIWTNWSLDGRIKQKESV